MRITRAVGVVLYLLPGLLSGQVQMFTANYSTDRTNANLQETTLNPANVGPGTFGKIATYAVDGQIYAQPLYVTASALNWFDTRNLLYVETMHNSIYCFDADGDPNAAPIWQMNLGPSVPSSLLKFRDIVPEIGILSTPVIDPAQGVIYLVSDTMVNGAPQLQLHALNVANGQEMFNGPVPIAASVAGPGDGTDGTNIALTAMQHLQRPGLLLRNGVLYLGFGSHHDQFPWHGWLLTYDSSTLTQLQVVNTTPYGGGGSIWQSGMGLASDDDGVYVGSANGDYDGALNFGSSFLKFAPDLTLLDWFTPDNWETLSNFDYDMGSAGPSLMPGTNLMIGGNKFGTLYLINRQSMGGLGPDNSDHAQSFQAIDYGGIFGFALWPRSDVPIVYVQEQGSVLKSYQIIRGAFNTSPYAQSTNYTDLPFQGMTISANGNGGGVLWETTGDHTISSVPGTLHAFDALSLAELWNSGMNPDQDQMGRFAKFVPPTVANGKVYVPTLSNELDVYGLLPVAGATGTDPQINGVLNAASLYGDAVAPGELVTLGGAYLGSDAPGADPSATQVLFDGTAAEVVSVSSVQVQAVVPTQVSAPSTQVQVQYQGIPSNQFSMPVVTSDPGVFSADGTGTGEVAAINEDGTVNSEDNAAPVGSIVTIQVTGIGLAPQLLSVWLDGQEAPVVGAGAAPGQPGVVQLSVVIPATVQPSSYVNLQVTVGTALSQDGITMAVM